MGLTESARTVAAMMELELRKLKYDRSELYWRTVQPLLWIVIFAPIMGAARAFQTGGVKYLDYIAPGVIFQATTFVAIFYGLNLIWERESGTLKKLLSSPASYRAIVLGRSLAAGLRAVFQFLIIVPLAILAGVTFSRSVPGFILAMLMYLLSSAGFASLSMFLASLMKSRERFMGIGQAISLPLFFASSALYPIAMMPPVIRFIASINPMSYAVDAVRGLLITGAVQNLAVDFAFVLCFDALIIILTAKALGRILE
jgi:ABC-2 type transport system permease protein